MTTHQPPGPIEPLRAHRRRVAAATGALAVVLMLVLTACTGGGGAAGSDDVATLVDPSASPDASPAASVDPEEQMQAFARCMRDHGVDIQISSAKEGDGGFVTGGTAGGVKPTGSGAPVTGTGTDKGKDQFEAANKACAPLLPKGGVNGPGGKMDPEMEQKLLAFSACMREHGVDMPDPKFENGGATVQIGGPDSEGANLDPTSQVFKDAQKACEGLMPGKLGADGGTGPVTQGSQP